MVSRDEERQEGEEKEDFKTDERFVYREGEHTPEAYFVFDPRGEYHAIIANQAVAVKKHENTQFEYIMSFIGDAGQVQQFNSVVVVKNVDVEKAKQLFEHHDYIVTEATETDFDEIAREIDKIATIKGGEHEKYDKSEYD